MFGHEMKAIMMPLANFGPETIGVLIPIFALIIPIVAILTKHQMNMAQIIHGRPLNEDNHGIPMLNDNSQLSEEVRQLRELMHNQAIALDNLRDEIKASHTIQERISQNS